MTEIIERDGNFGDRNFAYVEKVSGTELGITPCTVMGNIRVGEPRRRLKSTTAPLHRLANGKKEGAIHTQLSVKHSEIGWPLRPPHAGKVGMIPKHLALILSHIGLDATAWCNVVSKFGQMFKRATGIHVSLTQEAIRSGQPWLCARENPLGMSTV